ncbi:TPA: hypothetical protein CPT95_06530 [Candidatus Gastranaerophilales bacterium HUM_15]|nr:MAG TPA: hypothetical protein CPT95_06530 [Candidatus Gastranaerophilales bacterium HUM_15]
MNKNKNLKPKVLYKYTTFETGLKILETQTIRFSNPKTFNDPYDCNIPIKLKDSVDLDSDFFITLNNQIREYINSDTLIKDKLDKELEILKNSKEKLKINADIFLNKILAPLKEDMRVLSLSNTKSNLLMWGHYAKNHTGIAIGFDTNYKFFRNIIKIKYKKEQPRLGKSLINDLTLKNLKALEELRLFFHTKSFDWRYEQEYRCEMGINHLYNEFLSTPSFIKMFPAFFKEIENKNNFVHPYITPECVRAIYLGSRIDISNEEKIINIVQNKYTRAKIYKAFLSDTEFKIKFKQI